MVSRDSLVQEYLREQKYEKARDSFHANEVSQRLSNDIDYLLWRQDRGLEVYNAGYC